MTDQFGLKKWERITSLKTIDHLFNSGSKHFEYPFRLFYDFNLESPDKGKLEMAISVPKKRLRRANKRNRIKRLTREAFRLNNSALKTALEKRDQSLSIFLIFVGTADVNFDLVQDKIILILNRLQDQLLEPTTNSHL